jgi:integrase
MSVQRYETADGSRWRVRWRESSGQMRSRTVTSKSEATALDADLLAKKFKGEALPRPGRETLAAAYDEWWRLRGSQLSTNTQRTYTSVWNAHVKDRFDSHRISELASDPQLLEEFTAEMRDRDVGPAAQRKVLAVMSAVLTAAVRWKKIATNPVRQVPKPPATRQRHPHPFPPVVVERIRIRMRRRPTIDGTGRRPIGDACLVSLLSYAGLRPGEALALRFNDIGTRTIGVDKAVSHGKEGPTKTRSIRSVPIVAPLRDDLDEWERLRDPAGSHELLFPSRDGGHWSDAEFRNWRQRVWKPVLQGLAALPSLTPLENARPYDCRGSFVSLQLRAGASPLEVAQWAGHSPQLMFNHYANVIEELVGEPRLSADEQIIRARQVVADTEREELDELVADLFERPTLAAAGGSGAAEVLYAPAEAES